MRVLLTGGGALAMAIRKQLPCDIISLRSLPRVEWAAAVSGYDVIIHNAANLACKTFDEAIWDNFTLTANLIDTVNENNPRARFFYMSSMSMLRSEHEYEHVTNMSLYAFSKYLGEIYCLRHPLTSKHCFRFSTLFFGNPEKDGLSALIKQAVTEKQITLIDNGIAKRDFIPVDIAAGYLAKFARHKGEIPAVLNIASGVSTSFSQVAEHLARRVPGLTVNTRPSGGPSPTIVHEFSTGLLEPVGVVEHNLYDYIDTYLETLSIK